MAARHRARSFATQLPPGSAHASSSRCASSAKELVRIAHRVTGRHRCRARSSPRTRRRRCRPGSVARRSAQALRSARCRFRRRGGPREARFHPAARDRCSRRWLADSSAGKTHPDPLCCDESEATYSEISSGSARPMIRGASSTTVTSQSRRIALAATSMPMTPPPSRTTRRPGRRRLRSSMPRSVRRYTTSTGPVSTTGRRRARAWSEDQARSRRGSRHLAGSTGARPNRCRRRTNRAAARYAAARTSRRAAG